MGSNDFKNKRISYVVAPLAFKGTQSDELLTLTPNVFRKDLQDISNPYCASISINCLSKMCNEELAGLLYQETLPLFSCSKAVIRRKICILSYKMVYYNTDCLAEILPYLSDRIKDSDVNV